MHFAEGNYHSPLDWLWGRATINVKVAIINGFADWTIVVIARIGPWISEKIHHTDMVNYTDKRNRIVASSTRINTRISQQQCDNVAMLVSGGPYDRTVRRRCCTLVPKFIDHVQRQKQPSRIVKAIQARWCFCNGHSKERNYFCDNRFTTIERIHLFSCPHTVDVVWVWIWSCCQK